MDGSATTAELKELLEQLQQQESSMYAEWMQLQEETKTNIVSEKPAFDKQRVKELINAQMQASKPAPVKDLVAHSKKKWYTGRIAIAAAMIVCVMIAALWLMTQNGKQEKETTLAANETEIIASGELQKTIILRDSSVVLLYPGSSLQFDAGYNKAGRNLHLNGRARFTVAKKQDQPFVVYSKHLSATALGTVFEVQDSQDSTVISLIEGKVRVQDYSAPSKRTVYLLPGQRATGSKNNGIAVVQIKSEQPVLAQESTEKKVVKKHVAASLSFRQTPLVRVFDVLKKKYNVHIEFDKQAVSGMMFTGSFDSGESVRTILQVIASINKLEVHSGQQGYKIIK